MTLSWTAPVSGAQAVYYRLIAGTTSGASNLGSYDVGLATSVTATVPNGLYFVRLLAGYASGATAESRETSFGVGTAELPGTPGKPVVVVDGVDITVTFAPTACGSTPVTYVILAGTSPGVANLGEHPIGGATTLRARVATGRYQIRVVAANAIGRSAPSVETAFEVGLPGQPGPPVVTVNGASITLIITPPPSGALPTAWLVQAGTTPGGRQLGVFNVGSATAATATVGAGRYFVRTIGVNASGQESLASPEVEFSVLGDGRLSTEAAADIIAYNQSIGSSYRIPGFITRWELPVPVHVDPSMDINLVTQALELWKSWTGITYTFVPNVEPRLLVRTGFDGTRGGVDGTYSNNQARSGIAVIHPVGANSFDAVLHELGHALGILDHPNYPGAMGTVRGLPGYISPREAALARSLYQVPHGATVLPDGSWQVASLLPPGHVGYVVWEFGPGSTIRFTWPPPATGGPTSDYVLEIGTAPGLSDRAVLTTTSLSLSVALVPGTYYARVKARNAGGTGWSLSDLPVSFTRYPQ